jgi:NAD-dependent DNA ligase
MLASRFGSLAEAMQADQDDFAAMPGLGPVKARRLLEAFSQPFKRNLTGVQGAAGADGGANAGQQPATS